VLLPSEQGFFFLFWSFLFKIREINPIKTFFSNLVLFSRVRPVGATHEGVAPCALTIKTFF
jgi:hypothetical protein